MPVDVPLYEKRMHLMFPLDADMQSAESWQLSCDYKIKMK